jgi:multimeric flavodoxin WrbA
MDINILGVCGSPVKGEVTNTEHIVRAILNSCEKQGTRYGGNIKIKTDLVLLGESNIEAGCTHCNWCLNFQTADVFCSHNDDMKEIYPKIIEADGLIFGTPVYIGGMSWLMAAFIHRIRALLEGRYYGFRGPLGGVLKDKILAASSVAWVRHAGVETAMHSILLSGFVFDFVITGASLPALYGAGGVSAAPLGQLGGVRNDKVAMEGAAAIGVRVVERCCLIKAGKQALKYLPAYL